MSDHYQTLGVARDATPQQIKDAFRSLGYLHPDRCPKDPTAKARFAAVTEAYAELSDPARRARYDANPPVASRETRSALLRELLVEEARGVVELTTEIARGAKDLDPARASVRVLDKATSTEGRQEIRGFWHALRGLVG